MSTHSQELFLLSLQKGAREVNGLDRDLRHERWVWLDGSMNTKILTMLPCLSKQEYTVPKEPFPAQRFVSS